MPNSFTVFPNVLPGNVSIGGNLTVNGDQLRIGAAAPFVRLGKDGNGDLLLSENLGFDSLTLDVAATTAIRQALRVASITEAIRRINAAGTIQDKALAETLFTDYTTHAHTGTVTEDTIYTKIIPANTLGVNGGLRVHLEFDTGTNTAPGVAVRVRLGANAAIVFTVSPVAHPFWLDAVIFNINAANSQRASAVLTDLTGNTVAGFVNTIGTDTTVDNALSVTVQSVAAGDNQTLRHMYAAQLNSFGPV